MALLQNGFRDASAGVRIFGATARNNAYPYALNVNWDKTALRRNAFTAEGRSPKSGVPSGHLHPSSWMLPQKPGGMSAHSTARGSATVTGSIAAGRNIAGTSAGAATTTATGQLVVSGVGSAAGAATVSGAITAALNATASASGSAATSGAVTAKGNIVGVSAGVATTSAVRYATGKLVGSIAPAVTLDAANFSTYLLDEEDVETGMTLRQALRLIAAATAGKVSGAGTSTVTIRNAVADGASRIVATVDSSGNRTAITYDLD